MPTEIQCQRTTLSKPARFVLALVAVVAGVLLAVPGAQAATFCVGSPTGCSGITLPEADSLDLALETAALNGEPDLIRVGPGTYTPGEPGGFRFEDPTNGIEIRGEGPTETILETDGADETTLRVTGAGQFVSSVQDLGVRLSAAGGTPTGLVLAGGVASNVTVTAPAGLTTGLGVLLAGDATFADGSVNVPGLNGIGGIGDAYVNGASITAEVGVSSATGNLGVANSRIETGRIGIYSAVPTHLFNTLVHVRDGAGTEFGVVGTTEVVAAHLTVVGSAGPTYGMRASRVGGGTALHELDNSTVTGFDHDLSAAGDALSLASIDVEYSNFATKLEGPGGAINATGDNISLAPGFADPASGNFHLRHDSPLIDTGHDLGLADEGDLDYLPRFIDGDGTGGAEPDVGAYEYQRAAPVAAMSAPGSAQVGQTIELSAAGSSDQDAADALTYNWWFGDGTTASGPAASHAYSAPGSYAVTLQVTDPTGQEGTVTKNIVVSAPAGPAGTAAGDAGDRLAPVIRRLRVLPTRRLIRFRLSEPAGVTIRLSRVRAPRVARSLRLRGRTGANRVRLRRRLVRALPPGRYRVKVSARDAAGNQAKPRTARLLLPS